MIKYDYYLKMGAGRGHGRHAGEGAQIPYGGEVSEIKFQAHTQDTRQDTGGLHGRGRGPSFHQINSQLLWRWLGGRVRMLVDLVAQCNSAS